MTLMLHRTKYMSRSENIMKNIRNFLASLVQAIQDSQMRRAQRIVQSRAWAE